MYQQIKHYNMNARHHFNEKKHFQFCEAFTYVILTEKVYKKRYYHDGDIKCVLPSPILHICNIET